MRRLTANTPMDELAASFSMKVTQPLAELWDAACRDADFLQANNIYVEPTRDDEREARAIVFQTPAAPSRPTTPGAAVAVKRLLSRYDFSLQDESSRIRTYVTTRLLDLAESEKESIALGALEKLGKIADVGLFETKITIDIGKKDRSEIEHELQDLVARYENGLYVA